MATARDALYAEVTGPHDAPPMVFVHPNPMDNSCWLYQVAHFSSWYRCFAVDLPGYGRSPSAGPGLTMQAIAAACWKAVESGSNGPPAVLIGCSIGATVVQHMYHLHREATNAIVLSGTGWSKDKEFIGRHIEAYRRYGLGYRWDYSLQDLSTSFRHTPLAHWLARLFVERNATADIETIIGMMKAMAIPDPEWLQSELQAPVLILSGSEDKAHNAAFALRDRLPNAELATIQGAGHACHLEQPWAFDQEMMAFLRRHGHTHLPDVAKTSRLI